MFRDTPKKRNLGPIFTYFIPNYKAKENTSQIVNPPKQVPKY